MNYPFCNGLILAAQIVMSHASMTQLTLKELIEELKEIYGGLTSFQGGGVVEELISSRELEEVKEEVGKPPIPLMEIVKAKYVVCLECGKNAQLENPSPQGP
jgi:predicted transcriptional regulator